METELFAVVARILKVPQSEITIDSSPKTVGSWDSLRHMRIVVAVEEDFGIEFTEDEIVSIVDMRTLSQAVARHRS